MEEGSGKGSQGQSMTEVIEPYSNSPSNFIEEERNSFRKVIIHVDCTNIEI